MNAEDRFFLTWVSVLVGLILVGLAAVIIYAVRSDGQGRQLCRDKGGHPVDTDSRGSWLCISPDGRVLTHAS